MTITETSPIPANATEESILPDSKVLIGLSHGADDPESVLIAYLMGVEALRADKDAVMFLTKEGVDLAVEGAAGNVDVPGAPAIGDLHAEFVERGGRFYVCPVCVKVRGLTESTWAANVEIVGAPSVYEYTSGGALVFNY